MVDPIRSDMLKTMKGIQFKYSSFVNYTSALNCLYNRRRIIFAIQGSDNCHWIVSQVKFKPSHNQAKTKEMIGIDFYMQDT